MKIIVWGVNPEYINQIAEVMNNFEIVCFMDNDSSKWNTLWNGVKILPPPMVRYIEYDVIYIPDSDNYMQIGKQLVALGVSKEKVWNNIILRSYIHKGQLKIYSGTSNVIITKRKRVLIISTYLTYDGGTMAAIYAVEALKCRGYDVVLSSYDGNDKFIKEYRDKGISIIICPSIRYLNNEEITWISIFDLIIANTLVIISSACQLSGIKPVMLWIHEGDCMVGNLFYTVYKIPTLRYWNMDIERFLPKISIYGVSNIAKKSFNKYYTNIGVNVLSYSIPDESFGVRKSKFEKNVKGRLVYAIIGSIHPLKAQDIFIKAAISLHEKYGEVAEFWVIGEIEYRDFCKRVYDEYSGYEYIKFCGEMTRDEISNAYMNDIDVVVCASWQETMSIVLTEAMMYAKPSITTDATGMADYVEHGVNGLICKAGDVDDLRDKMEWMIVNRDKLENMGINARKTYEEYFTMDKFADRLENAIDATCKGFEERKKLCPLDM
jgi:glycosyltransferase involved in cell wall biosynthesis